MANIRKRQTKASQTILSHFKVDSEVKFIFLFVFILSLGSSLWKTREKY